ncbi:hypothetical protein Q7P37_008850 [Cladosporium fusiforme]
MVQYMPAVSICHGYRGVSNELPATYWKLGVYEHFTIKEANEFLTRHDYGIRKGASKSAVRELVGRFQRGLLSYRSCTGNELRMFCRDRHLAPKRPLPFGLIDALQRADDEALFPKFLALPAEIRNAIYELHVRSFGDVPAVHRQPPVTMASRQLRSESLPLFYECATFTFICEYQPDEQVSTIHFNYYEETKTTNMKKMPQANLDLIKRLKFCFYNIVGLSWCDILLDYSTNLQLQQRISVSDTSPGRFSNHRHESQLVHLESNLRKTIQMQNNIQKEGGLKLRKADLDLVELAVGDVVMGNGRPWHRAIGQTDQLGRFLRFLDE